MFNWTTTTLINEIPENFIKSINNDKALRIGKHIFEKRWVESIRKAEGHKMELCKATINMTKVKEAMGDATVARLYIYVGLDGSEESIYANDWYRKGMPFSVSFAMADTASEMATAIETTIKDFNIFTKVKKVLNATADGANLIIEGTHEHQRLEKIAVLVGTNEVFVEETPVIEWTLRDARYKEYKDSENGATNYADSTGVTLNEAGKNGFGTYSQLLKDLRLPTANHNHWLSVHKDEMPIVGALYDQYIITYYAPSTSNPSFTAVGNRSMSETTHVFWVNSSAPAKNADGEDTTVGDLWETALASIDPDGGKLNDNTAHAQTKTVYTNKKTSLVERVETLEKEA